MKKILMALAITFAMFGTAEASNIDNLSPQDQQATLACSKLTKAYPKNAGFGCLGQVIHPRINFTVNDVIFMVEHPRLPEVKDMIAVWCEVGEDLLKEAVSAREGLK